MLHGGWKENKMQMITWGLLCFFALFYFLGLYYTDIYATYNHSLMLLDCLREGRLFEFYEVTMQKPVCGVGAFYFIPIYIVFAVWNLPVWIVTRFMEVGIDNLFCMLWSKGIVIFFSILSIWMLYRILAKMKYDHLEYAIFLFASSLFLFVPALAVSQYDVIHIFFTLWGIDLYVTDEKISWRVLAIFSIAISMKLFAFFPFVILILLNEKRIRYIMCDLVYGILFSVMTILPWYKGYKVVSQAFNGAMLENLMALTFPGGLGDISIFMFGFCIILLVAYLTGSSDIKCSFEHLTWLVAAFFILFFATVHANPYWIVMLIPFLVPIIFKCKENYRISIILETIIEGTMILVQGFYYSAVYFSENSFSYLIFRDTDIKLGQGATTIVEILEYLGMSNYIPGVYSVFVACAIALLAVNNPWAPIRGWGGGEAGIGTETVLRFIRIGLVGMYLFTTYVIAY